MEIRQSTAFCLVALFLADAGICRHHKSHKTHELRGIVRDRFLGIPEDSRLPTRLITAGSSYELDFSRAPTWKAQVPKLDGKEIIARGTLRIVPRRRLGRRDWFQILRDWMHIQQRRPGAARQMLQVHHLQIVADFQ